MWKNWRHRVWPRTAGPSVHPEGPQVTTSPFVTLPTVNETNTSEVCHSSTRNNQLQLHHHWTNEASRLSSETSYPDARSMAKTSSTPEFRPQGNSIHCSGDYSLLGVGITSWTQLTSQWVQCWNSCRNDFLQGNAPPHWRCMWRPWQLTKSLYVVCLWGDTT